MRCARGAAHAHKRAAPGGRAPLLPPPVLGFVRSPGGGFPNAGKFFSPFTCCCLERQRLPAWAAQTGSPLRFGGVWPQLMFGRGRCFAALTSFPAPRSQLGHAG